MIFFNLNLMLIYLAQEAQMVLLIIEKIQILSQYSNYSNIFLEEKTLILPKAINLNKYTIEF